MKKQFVSRNGNPSCYACDSVDIEGVCHHCGKLLCNLHIVQPLDVNNNLNSEEFSTIGLSDQGLNDIPVHCKSCAHAMKRPKWYFLAGGIALFISSIFVLGSGSTLGGGALLIVGLATTFLSYIGYKRTQREWQEQRPAFPLMPLKEVLWTEEIKGTISLASDGSYSSEISTIEGTLNAEINLNERHSDFLKEYEKSFKVSDLSDTVLRSGFVLLKGDTALDKDFLPPINSAPNTPDTVSFSNEVNQFFNDDEKREIIKHTHSFSHTTKLDNIIKAAILPIKVYPSFQPLVNRHGLDVEITWDDNFFFSDNAGSPYENPLEVKRIEEFQINVPAAAWGNIKSVYVDKDFSDDQGTPLSSEGMDGNRPIKNITWKKIRPKPQNQRIRFSLGTENDILSPDASPEEKLVTGSITVLLDQPFSSIKGINVFSPLGDRVKIKTELKSCVSIDFSLHLDQLQYQSEHQISSLNSQSEADDKASYKCIGAVPDLITIVALTNELSKEGFYTKRVIETPPSATNELNVITRLWNIHGRYYEGVWPVDFHMILTGEERHGAGIHAETGSTEIKLTVRGRYTNVEMKESIENVWERLMELARRVVDQNIRKDTKKPVVQEAFSAPSSMSTPPSDTNTKRPSTEEFDKMKADRKIKLKDQQDKLRDKYLDDKISKEDYEQMFEEIKKELDQLG